MITKTQILKHLKDMSYTRKTFFEDWDGYVLEDLLSRLPVTNVSERIDWFIDSTRNTELNLTRLVALANLPIYVYECSDCKETIVYPRRNNEEYILLEIDKNAETEVYFINGSLVSEMYGQVGQKPKHFQAILCENCKSKLNYVLGL